MPHRAGFVRQFLPHAETPSRRASAGVVFTVSWCSTTWAKGGSAIFENGSAKIQSGTATFKFGTATHLPQFLRALSHLSPSCVSARGGNTLEDFQKVQGVAREFWLVDFFFRL